MRIAVAAGENNHSFVEASGRGPEDMRTQLAIGLRRGEGVLTQSRGQKSRRAWARGHAHATRDWAAQGRGRAYSESWSGATNVLVLVYVAFFFLHFYWICNFLSNTSHYLPV